jgi:hypothetical protein
MEMDAGGASERSRRAHTLYSMGSNSKRICAVAGRSQVSDEDPVQLAHNKSELALNRRLFMSGGVGA